MPLLSLGRDERGFTMVTVIITMMVVMLLSVAALSAAQNDLPAGKHDADRKIAYAAAEAGVQYYLHHLVEDPTYWSKCTNVGGPVNNRWDGASTRN
jgi:Tfp pilus assembly protein PilX